MITVAKARTEPAELINAAVDALVRRQFELPSLDALGRLVASVDAKVNVAQSQRIGDSASEEQRSALEALLRADPATQESSFAQICRAPCRSAVFSPRLRTPSTGRSGRGTSGSPSSGVPPADCTDLAQLHHKGARDIAPRMP
jgi:hypothetical protein